MQFLTNFYDKQGKVITIEEYGELDTPEYKQCDRSTVGEKVLSTVWLGLDHNVTGREIHIFETAEFKNEDDMSDVIVHMRYETLEQAMQGHMNILERMKKKHLEENPHLIGQIR